MVVSTPTDFNYTSVLVFLVSALAVAGLFAIFAKKKVIDEDYKKP